MEEQRRQDALRSRQAGDLAGLERAHNEELAELNRQWDERQKLQAEAFENQEKELRETHEFEMKEYREEQERRQPFRPKWSPQLLNHRKIEHTFVRQRRYEEAAATKQVADAMEAEEEPKLRRERLAPLAALEEKLAQRQRAEMEAHEMRVRNGWKEFAKQRAVAQQVVTQRYQNLRRDLEAGHQLEVTHVLVTSVQRMQNLRRPSLALSPRGSSGQVVLPPLVATSGLGSAASPRRVVATSSSSSVSSSSSSKGARQPSAGPGAAQASSLSGSTAVPALGGADMKMALNSSSKGSASLGLGNAGRPSARALAMRRG